MADDMTRYLVVSRMGLGRDLEILDENEQRAFFVDGKMGFKPQAEVQDPKGEVVMRADGKLLGIPKRMTLRDASGAEQASLRARISPIKSRIEITLADGREWLLEGNLIEKDYTVKDGDRVVMAINQKWATVRDRYAMDVAADVTPALAAAILWTVDAFREQ